jgi:hypothetical protein
MFQDEPAGPAGPRLGAYPSIAVELDWALSAAHRPGESSHPALDQLYRDRPDLAERIRSLWGPEEQLSYPGYLELSVLARQSGVLFTADASGLLDGLEAGAAAAPRSLVLASELPDDRIRVLRRLHLLRSSAARRRRYVGLMREVWAALEPEWESVGRKAVDAAVASRRSLLARSRPAWQEFARNEGCPQTNIQRLVELLGPDDELAVVPAHFSRRGLIFDLPGILVVGVQARPSGSESRARTEHLARQLKAISDPTRLAILDALARRDLTVTELAELFDLAQPTVSNHIKVLRDAGVVGNPAGSARRRLAVQRPVVKEMLTALQEVVEPEPDPGSLG